jgi:hypothetical protein
MRNHASLVPDSAGMAGSALVREHAASETWQAYMELNTKIWHAANRGDGAARSRKETNNRMEKLKPCPFCGGVAEYRQFANPRNFYSVACVDCHCSTDGFRNKLDNDHKENKAVQAAIWNKRVGRSADW